MQSSGGTYSGDLLLDFTTHLVYKDLDVAKQGEKYATAQSWGIPVLPLSWLRDSAECARLLPSTYKPYRAEPEAASPAAKLQQLCLQEGTLNAFVTAQRPLCGGPTNDQPASESLQLPPDTGSQVHRQSVTHNSCQQHSTMQPAELLSCSGSFDPEQPEPPQAASPGLYAVGDHDDDDGSDTCSNRTIPDQADAEAQVCCDATQIAHPPDSGSDDLIIPDSQPDDFFVPLAGQHHGPVMTPDAEARAARELHHPATEAQAMTSIPDSPLEMAATIEQHLRTQPEQNLTSLCKPGIASRYQITNMEIKCIAALLDLVCLAWQTCLGSTSAIPHSFC